MDMSGNITESNIFGALITKSQTEEEENNATQTELIFILINNTDSFYYPPKMIAFGAICMILQSVLAIVANSISILALLKSKWLKKITTAFIVNLCVSDLFKSCCIMTNYVIVYRTQKWNGGESTCKFYNILIFLFILLSMLTVSAIALNRYILIAHPRFYLSIFRMRNTVIMIISVWALAIFRTLSRYFKVWGVFGYDGDTGECAPMDYSGNVELYPYFLVYIVPLILFTLCYANIFYVVRKTERNTKRHRSNIISYVAHVSSIYWREEMEDESNRRKYKNFRNKKERRLFQMILVIFLCYILCFIPVCVVKMMQKEKEYPSLYIACNLPLYLSNVINPIIYIVMSEEYRKAYKDLFRCSADNG